MKSSYLKDPLCFHFHERGLYLQKAKQIFVRFFLRFQQVNEKWRACMFHLQAAKRSFKSEFPKQHCQFNNIRLLIYQGIRNMEYNLIDMTLLHSKQNILTFFSRGLSQCKFLVTGCLNCIRMPGPLGLLDLLRSVTSAEQEALAPPATKIIYKRNIISASHQANRHQEMENRQGRKKTLFPKVIPVSTKFRPISTFFFFSFG